MKKVMTKKSKSKVEKRIKVWAVLDGEGNLVGAHHTKKYIADMNAMFVENGKVLQAMIIYNVPKKKKK